MKTLLALAFTAILTVPAFALDVPSSRSLDVPSSRSPDAKPDKPSAGDRCTGGCGFDSKADGDRSRNPRDNNGPSKRGGLLVFPQ
jgi:hypothetical protein